MKCLGKGCYIWTTDLARAYRQLRVCPLAYPLLGMLVEDQFFVDLAPPFGARTSALACERTTKAVQWLIEKKKKWIRCYLDDFVGAEKTEIEAQGTYKEVISVTSHLGLELAPAKCTPPTTQLTWLGYTVNTLDMTVTIPEVKLQETLEVCKVWLKKTHASRSQLRSLFGKLKHIANCIPAAACFLNRVLDTLRETPFTGQHALDTELKKDLHWFIKSACSLNGIFLIPPPATQDWVIECDSSLVGAGAFSKTSYFAEEYTASFLKAKPHITSLEAINLVTAVKHLLPDSPNKCVIVINTDNKTSQQVLSTGKGRDKLLTACTRQLWLIAAEASTTLRIIHKPGAELVLADALSRVHMLKYKQLAERECKRRNLKRIRVMHTWDILSTDL